MKSIADSLFCVHDSFIHVQLKTKLSGMHYKTENYVQIKKNKTVWHPQRNRNGYLVQLIITPSGTVWHPQSNRNGYLSKCTIDNYTDWHPLRNRDKY